MGAQSASVKEPENRLEIFWSTRPVKFTFPSGLIHVEEVKTPWDLYVESRFFDSPIGTTFHQTLVKHGLERIFSIRDKAGIPACDIITRPEDAPQYNFAWGMRRVFKTSCPMVVDGQRLIVLEVTAQKGHRAEEPILGLAKQFFLSQGGVLRGEHPNGLIYTNKREIRRWRNIIDENVVLDMMVGSKPIKEAQKHLAPDTVFVPNADIAIELFGVRYWYRCHINADDEWTDKILDYLERNPEDQPNVIEVYGNGPRFKKFFARADAMMSKPLPEKKK